MFIFKWIILFSIQYLFYLLPEKFNLNNISSSLGESSTHHMGLCRAVVLKLPFTCPNQKGMVKPLCNIVDSDLHCLSACELNLNIDCSDYVCLYFHRTWIWPVYSVTWNAWNLSSGFHIVFQLPIVNGVLSSDICSKRYS